MTAALAEPVVLGDQTPRISYMPPGDIDWTLGDQCIAWTRDTLRITLLPWECHELRNLGGRRPDGRWACPEYGLLVSRRNGKSMLLLIWALFCLLELGHKDWVFTAHQGRTIRQTFRLLKKILRGAVGLPDFMAYNSDGRERIEFDEYRCLWLSTRTAAGGRGEGANGLIIDEAQEADDAEMEALSPILGDRSATGQVQLIYAGSSGNYRSVVFGRARRQALKFTSARLGWSEYSIDDVAYLVADAETRMLLATSVESTVRANPSLGYVHADGTGITLDWLQGQVDILSPAGFAREHLAVGTWPKDESHDWVIPRGTWQSLVTEAEGTLPAIVLALSASWGDRSVSLAAAGGLDDGRCLAWLAKQGRGTAWLVPLVVDLCGKNQVQAVLLDDGGPAKPLADPLEQALAPLGVKLVRMSYRDAASACGGLFDAVTAEPSVFAHLGQPEVDAALAGAKQRDVGAGLWCFDRDKSETDVAPLEAVAFARHGWVSFGNSATESWGFFE